MKLMTKALEKKLEKYPLYSQESKGDDAQVVIKYFAPEGAATWLVLEGEKQEDGDWMFFGHVNIGYGWEIGYFMLSDLERVRTPRFRLPLERDLYANGTVGEVK